MVDETTPLRETVDRSGYAFNMAVAGIIENSGDRQKWKLDAMEIPWSKEQSSGFVDLTITRDRAIGVLECKKVNNGDQLVFLVRQGQTDNEIRCRLDVLRKEIEPTKGILDFHQLRYGTNECTMATGSSESAYCVAPKGNKSANLNLDNIASDLLVSCEGLLGNWTIKLPGDPTVCIPIIVTNALLYTCTFDPSEMHLDSGDLPPEAAFKRVDFVRFRKAFRQGAGYASLLTKNVADAVSEGERTVFVVDSRKLVEFLAQLRKLFSPHDRGSSLLVSGD